MATVARSVRVRLGESLLHRGLINEPQLKEAMARQRVSGKRIGQVLVEMRLVTEREITEVLAQQLNVPFIDLQNYIIDPATARIVPEHVARKYQLIPINKVGSKLTVAMVDPLNILAIDEVQLYTGLQVKAVVASHSDLTRSLQAVYAEGEKVTEILGGIDGMFAHETEIPDFNRFVDEVIDENSGPVIKLVEHLISSAVLAGASDIHIEPFEKEVRVRFRRDGVLRTELEPPRKAQAAIISRIKILADMNIAEKRLPQDGRIKTRAANRSIDLRVSTLPSAWGEKVVMRILDQSGLRVNLEDLGFEPSSYEKFKESIATPHGIVLVTGPTGSGKTTTLYSALSTINQVGVNVLTAEDPIEYQLHGITQVQCKAEIGYDFAKALRSFLRQDPDVIMVGEIRDYETAEIAIKASMTGHLVLSTLHTNDAPSTIGRLLNMGVEPFMVTSSVILIQAQRLVRKVCKDCRQEYRPRPDQLDPLRISPDLLRRLDLPHVDPKAIKLFRGNGCDACQMDGHRGRCGVYEVMPMSEPLREMVLRGASTTELFRQAKQEGMLSLRESAVRKALLGITSLEEVLRVTAADR